MKPMDDPTWPDCGFIHDPPDMYSDGRKHWCSVVREKFAEGLDAPDIMTGLRYCVPVVPVNGWYAELAVDTELLAGMSAKLFLVKESDPFTLEEELIPLGLWTNGEGRMSMAIALNSWIDSQDTDKCTWSAHSFEEEMKCQALAKSADENSKKVNTWCLAYYGCCSACWVSRNTASQGAQTWDASSFGVDPSTVGTRSAGQTVNIQTQGTPRQQNILQNLQQRYSNRELIVQSDHNWYNENLSPREQSRGQ